MRRPSLDARRSISRLRQVAREIKRRGGAQILEVFSVKTQKWEEQRFEISSCEGLDLLIFVLYTTGSYLQYKVFAFTNISDIQ